MKEWEKKMFRILPFTQRMLRWKWYWQNELIGTLIFTRPRANQMVQNMVLKFINKKIKDPVLREKLIPDYTMGCKRITPSKEYYPALLRPNVDLVNAGIKKVEGNTVFTADGKQYETDAIVLATGFKAADAPVDFVVKGRGGRILAEDWKEGPEAYYGSTVTGYPNLFFLIGPNTGLGHNSMIFVIESQVNYVLDGIKNLEQRKAKFMDVKPEAQKVYNDVLQEKLKRTVWATGCRSWYIAANGRNTTVWPQLTYTMWFKMKHIKAKDYEFVK
jgi:cation diffusion facilitator CzcD-associated flavoprotein CzcO